MNALDQLRSLLPAPDGDADTDEAIDLLRKRITILSDRAWDGKVDWQLVTRWLANFDGRSGLEVDVERLHALYLLSQFLYFGSAEIRVLLRALFRDLFFLPLVQEVRAANGNTRDLEVVNSALLKVVAKTRFVGTGSSSESGVHLLYFFRQENGLSKNQFLDSGLIMREDLSPASGKARRVLTAPEVDRYIFVDDVCGSGDTAVRYSQQLLTQIAEINPDIQTYYYALFATTDGLRHVRENSLFSRCGAVFELDETFKCLSDKSRYLKFMPSGIAPDLVRRVARHYGELLWPGHGAGFEDSQMLLGFDHNTPDNTLPLIWMDGPNRSGIPWTPVFRRYPKV